MPDTIPPFDFKNRKQALEWLKEQGFNVSRGKFYQDVTAGRCIINPVGSISRLHVALYMQAQKEKHLLRQLSDYEYRERRQFSPQPIRLKQREYMTKAEGWNLITGLIRTYHTTLLYRLQDQKKSLIAACEGNPAQDCTLFDFLQHLAEQVLSEIIGNDPTEKKEAR